MWRRSRDGSKAPWIRYYIPMIQPKSQPTHICLRVLRWFPCSCRELRNFSMPNTSKYWFNALRCVIWEYGIHVWSPVFHFISKIESLPNPAWVRMASTAYSLSKPLALPNCVSRQPGNNLSLFGTCGCNKEAWNMSWISCCFICEGKSILKVPLPKSFKIQ